MNARPVKMYRTGIRGTILMPTNSDFAQICYLRVTKKKYDIAADFWMSSCAAGNVSLRICCHCILETRGVEDGGLVWLSLMLCTPKYSSYQSGSPDSAGDDIITCWFWTKLQDQMSERFSNRLKSCRVNLWTVQWNIPNIAYGSLWSKIGGLEVWDAS